MLDLRCEEGEVEVEVGGCVVVVAEAAVMIGEARLRIVRGCDCCCEWRVVSIDA